MKTHPAFGRTLRSDLHALKTLTVFGLVFAGCGLSPANAASGTINGDVGDGQANSDGTVTATTATYGRLGGDAGVRHSVVHVFQIPSSIVTDSSQQFSSATYSTKLGMGSTMTANGDLYGLGYDVVPTLMGSDFYEGSLDAGSTLIQDNFITPSTPAYTTVTNSSTALVNYLNAALAEARTDGATTAYVFLRNSLDAYTWSGVYIMGMNEAGGAYVPTLAYNTVSVSNWSSVPLGGGGFVTGLVSDATGADLYARTDVGGLFKWNAVGGNWINLTDKIVATTARFNTTAGLLGTMSVAVDPSNANNLYVAVGGGSVSGTTAGIYASSDKGATWTEITTGTPNFSINGNGGARSQGERLVVDPNNPNTVWYGTETSGLMKGVKSGSTWTWTQVASASVPFGTNSVGVPFVVCDKNGTSTITYAGVYDSTGSTGGIYMTPDGTNWTKVTGVTLAKPARAAIASDGTLFVTGAGIVANMPRGGALAAITPATGNDYRGLAINAAGTTVYVANVSSGTCTIWRSASGGATGTWTNQSTAYFNNWNFSASRIYASEPDGTACVGYQWFGNVAALWVNPANVNELWASDFYGVQRTQSANLIGNTAVNTQPVWYRLLKNLEETVVFSVKNAPTGNRLLTGVADIGGFRYATSDSQRPLSTNGGGLNGTSGKNITSIDFSEGNPSVWAYAWALNDSTGTGAVSLDGGANWLRFGQIARQSLTNSTTAGWETFDLGNYLTKQRAKGVTTVTFVVAGGAPWWEDTPSMSFGSRESANPPRLILNGGAPLAPLADTYVYKNATTTNYGAAQTLSVRYNGGYDTLSYLKFDISGTATISSAQLQLYRNSSADTHVLNVGVHACTNITWVEGDGGTDNLPAGEMRWDNRPYAMTDAASGDPLSSTPNYQQGGVSLRGGRIAISATDPTVMVWAPIGSTARYSEDRGVTWTASTGAPASQITGVYTNGNSLDPSGQNLVADRVNGNFYLATFGGTSHSVYRSIDGGKTWTLANTVANGGTYNMRTPQLAAAPASPLYPSGGDLWLCDDSSYNNSPFPAGGLWRSVDGGTNWTKFSTIGRVSQVAFGASSTGTGYAVYANGEIGGLRKVYRSDDYGVTWVALAALPSTITINSLAGDRQNYGKVFIGTPGRGVFMGQ